MLKLQYDLKTGEVKKAYPSAYDVAVPYIEIDEATNDKISQDAETIYFVANGELTTTPTDAYKVQQQQELDKVQAFKNITKRQLLFWLYVNKKKTEDDILAAINTIADTDKKYLATVSYNGTNNFYYGNEYTQEIATVLGFTTDELKKCFDEAGTL